MGDKRNYWCVSYKRSRRGVNSQGTPYRYWEPRCLGVVATTIDDAIEAVRRIPPETMGPELVGEEVVILTVSHRGVVDIDA